MYRRAASRICEMQSAFPRAFIHLGPMGEYFADTVKTNTSGTVELRLYEPGALVPALAIMEVLDKLEAAWMEVAQEQSEKHPEFKEAWDSLSAFRKQYDSWADKAYLE